MHGRNTRHSTCSYAQRIMKERDEQALFAREKNCIDACTDTMPTHDTVDATDGARGKGHFHESIRGLLSVKLSRSVASFFIPLLYARFVQGPQTWPPYQPLRHDRRETARVRTCSRCVLERLHVTGWLRAQVRWPSSRPLVQLFAQLQLRAPLVLLHELSCWLRAGRTVRSSLWQATV